MSAEERNLRRIVNRYARWSGAFHGLSWAMASDACEVLGWSIAEVKEEGFDAWNEPRRPSRDPFDQ